MPEDRRRLLKGHDGVSRRHVVQELCRDAGRLWPRDNSHIGRCEKVREFVESA